MNNVSITQIAEVIQRDSDYVLDLEFCTKTANSIVEMLEQK